MTFFRKNQQRLLGFLLICVESAALGYLSQTVFFPVSICVSALVAVLTNIRFSPSQRTASCMTAGLTLLFIAKYRLAPLELRSNQMFFDSEFPHAIAQLLLVIQVAQFFLDKYNDRLPAILPGLAGIVLICTADIRISSQQRTVFQLFAVCFAVLSALYFSASRKPVARLSHTSLRTRTVTSGAILFVIVIVAWFSASTLYHNESRIDRWISRILATRSQSGSIGFTGKGQLGSVAWRNQVWWNQIALRVYAQHTPGYLRGMAFDEYSASEWFVSTPGRDTLNPINQPPNGILPTQGNQKLFALNGATSGHWQEAGIWPHARFKQKCFTPLGTTHLRTDSDDVTVDDHAIIETDGRSPAYHYTAYIPTVETVTLLSPVIERRLIEFPADLDPRIQNLAELIFDGCSTTREKTEAVERYFHDHYQYSLGMAAPPDQDPMTHFLLQKPGSLRKPAGHCVFFATGAALLLRISGVPCRYITGFVANERNDFGNYWVSRNNDAHAWVEAFDPQQGWIIVEATPAQGVPGPSPPSQATQFSEYLRDRIHMFHVTLWQGRLRSIATACLLSLIGVPSFVLALAIILVTAFYLRRKSRLPQSDRQDHVLQHLHRLLNQMDAQLRKQNLQRRHSETLHQFADRIAFKPVAAWYRQYALLRYATLQDRDSVADLEQVMKSTVDQMTAKWQHCRDTNIHE